MARLVGLALVAAATLLAVGFPPDPRPDRPVPRITGEIQYFTLKQNPRAAPDASFREATGRDVRLGDFRGRVVILNFWATWCAPCVHEMPSLDRLAQRFRGAPVALVALNEDREGAAVAAPFMAKLGLRNTTLYTDPNGAAQRAFEVKSLPTTIIIDARGREAGRLVGPADWSSPEAVALIEFFVGAAR